MRLVKANNVPPLPTAHVLQSFGFIHLAVTGCFRPVHAYELLLKQWLTVIVCGMQTDQPMGCKDNRSVAYMNN